MSEQEQETLDTLLDRWEERWAEATARSRQIKTGDLQAAYYFRGVAETYKTALAELRKLVDGGSEKAAEPEQRLLQFTQEQVSAMMTDLGLFPRILRRHDDGAFTAVFSRLQPVSQARRLELLQSADRRLRILQDGALHDTGDPYIEFGFVDED
ncbi:MAG TPA: hypothetical protein VER79_04860 [Candidatus Limnocylindrales bacterium]|nr:hypothetical protein [Candidatus Limnocylindrales bacterium]